MSDQQFIEELFGEPSERRIEHYRLIETIGFGGMGGVYKAVDGRTSETVALKILHKDLTLEADVLERFKREIKILSSIRHGNVVEIREYGEHDGLPFFVMEYVSGMPLSRLIERIRRIPRRQLRAGHLLEALQSNAEPCSVEPLDPPIPPEESYERAFARIAALLAGALGYLHGKGVIHRDIKPSNVILRPNGSPVLMDMGVARAQGDSRITGTGRIVGTWRYQAPEQILAPRLKADEKTDVYQIGATLYEFLFLTGFYEGYNEIELREAKSKEDPCAPEIDGAPPARLSEIVLRCVVRDRSRRYDGAAQLAADLQQFYSAT